jgi:predicted metal-dependent hydrolase
MKFEYRIRNSRRARNIRITVNSKGEVVLTKPNLIPQFVAVKFLESKESWVLEQLKKTAAKKFGKNKIFYKGEKYKVEFEQGKFNYQFKDGVLKLTGPSEKMAKSALVKKLKDIARSEIRKSVKKFSAKMELEYMQVRLKDQSSRWGSCSSKNNLNFNWRLILTPKSVLDYVVIHELAHLKEMNHGHKFWALVEKYDPDYREHRRWLKRNQQHLYG